MKESQMERVLAVMKGGEWVTLREIELITGDPQSSISAQLRHLRKSVNGGHVVEKRVRSRDEGLVWEYRLREETCSENTNS